MKKRFWFQIHWLLAIVLGIIIAIIGVTGAALSFRSEILSFINKDTVFVQPNGRTPLSIDKLLEKVDGAMPNSRINSLTLAYESDRTTRVSISNANSTNMRGKNYYIDPYTAEILPDLKGEEFFSLMLRWHRWLGNMSSVGKQIVAIATVALIILSLTGLYLYWPLLRHKFFSALTIDFKKKGRGFLYKLHSVFGIWTLIFVLLMSFTGLFWSYEWYRNGLYWLAGVERPMPRMRVNTNATAPQNTENALRSSGRQNAENSANNMQNRGNRDANTSTEHFITNEHKHETAGRNDLQKNDKLVAASNINANFGANLTKTKTEREKTEASRNFDIRVSDNINKSEIYLAAAQAYELFKNAINNDYITTTMMLPQSSSKIFTFSYYPSNPAHSRASNQLQLDMEKNEVIKHSKYEDKKLGEKFISSIFPLHSGDFFGIPGLILYCISSLAMALFAITGYMLYYGRFIKNRKKTKRKDA
ncbi:MAG: PepSY domain-containing protein [Campylobacteraceae bacterium]|jgi:sulfite reductase (NADPH) flavoprotein alpha-component|nr:PepSY domain-containing protein [Campylobacteraceae bacterium]